MINNIYIFVSIISTYVLIMWKNIIDWVIQLYITGVYIYDVAMNDYYTAFFLKGNAREKMMNANGDFTPNDKKQRE